MHTVSANEAKTRFAEFLDTAQREPVGVMRHSRLVGVLVSPQDYEAMRAFYANRLAHTLHTTAEAAQAAGLDEAGLKRLLSDES